MRLRDLGWGVAIAILATAEPAGAQGMEAEPGGLAVAEAEPPVVVRVGRALDLEGRPVYAARSEFSGTAAVAGFSLRPVPSAVRLSGLRGPASAPLAGAPVTSGFGYRTHPLFGTRRFHAGVDLAAPTGSPIRASSAGIVTRAGGHGGYGLLVAIGHVSGEETRYGHLSRLAVSAGQTVKQGDVIGFVGSTGRSTGPHLHFERRINGQAVRPSH